LAILLTQTILSIKTIKVKVSKLNNMRTFTKYFWATIVFLSFSISSLFSQVNADFSATPTSGCAPIFAQFTDLSTSNGGNIVSWSWQLGGNTSSTQNPGKAFTSGGSYTICLTVTDNQGNTDTECKTNYLTFFNSPQAQFNATPSIGCLPLSVQLTNNSTVGSGAINLYQWAFGDGNAGAGTTVNNTYTSVGNYDVTLSVTDVNGCSDVTTVNDMVLVNELDIVDFSASQRQGCDTPFTVTFTDLTMPNPNLTYLWDFGDGNTSTLQNPTHTYTQLSNFDVQLTVTDNVLNCSRTRSKNNYIRINSLLSFTHTPTAGCEPFNVAFTNTSPGNSSNWFWDFGDGYTSTQQNPTHTYQTSGCYFVDFTATRTGCVSTVTSPNCIQVHNLPQPSYTINSSDLACAVPHAVSFSGTSNLAGGTYLWDFGDGNTSTAQNPSHTYVTFGVFPVSFTAISAQGCSATVITETVRIRPVNADFSVDTIKGCSPLGVTFTDESFSLFPIISYNWNIIGGAFSGTFTTTNPTITLTDTAAYNMTLTVTNSQGCSDSTTINDIVSVGFPPIADFAAIDTAVCVDENVTFINLSSTWADDFAWDLGDGGTDVATNPTWIYADTGSYDIKLKATHNGCINQIEKLDYIEVLPARAEFSVLRNCITPYTISFINQSVGEHRYFWNFGVTAATNDTANIANPIFTFPDRGNYIVTLTVFNDSTGCIHDYSQTVIITNPIADFSFSANDGCAPLNIQVSNNSTNGNSYQWIVPGATISNAGAANPTIRFLTAGTYNDYKLIVTDLNGCRDTVAFNDTINVYDVYPEMSADQFICPGETVQFTDISTTSDGIITNWAWTFDNGQTSTLQNPTATFTYQDTFGVRLVVTNSYGCTRTRNRGQFMQVTQPDVNFETQDTFVCSGQDVNFTNLSSGKGRPLTNYLWDFGDGNTSTLETPTHNYNTQGFFTVCLTVTDIQGCDSSFCITDLVRVVNPQANFAADSLQAPCPILVTNFSDSSTNTVSWAWDFGDGIGTSSNQNPSYTYVNSGSFDVSLVVTDVNGCTDTLIRPDYISINGAYGDFSVSPLDACPNDTIVFTGNGFNVTRYIWDYGDGNFVINTSTDTVNVQTYNYGTSGSYFPLLILEGVQGCIEVLSSSIPVIVDNLFATITTSDSIICDTATVSFTPTFISNLPVDSFYWDFNGFIPNSSDTVPFVFFSTPGVYPVTLHFSTSDCANSETVTIVVGRDPQASFMVSPMIGCTPQVATMQSTSTLTGSYAGDAIDKWSWDFDYLGAVDSTANPLFTYIDSGFYNIQLITGTVAGCFDTTITQIRVNLTPTADAGTDKTICLQNGAFLNGSGVGNYLWSNAATLDNDTIAAPIASPIQTTDYILTVTSAEGCFDKDTVTVIVVPVVAQQVNTSNDTTICEGDVIQLFAYGSPTVLAYVWDTTQAGLSCYESCNNPFAGPASTTTYYVTLYTSAACYDTDSIEVIVIDENQNIVGADVTICSGDSIQLNTTIGTNPIWSPSNNISCVFCPNPYIFPTATTDYIVQTTTTNGCKISDTVTITIFDNNLVNAGEDIGTCIGNSVQLNGTGIGTFSWSGDATISDPLVLNPNVTPVVDTDYYLTVQNGNCIIQDTVTVFLVEGATLEDGEFTICANDPTQISVEGFAAEYLWTPEIGLSDPTEKRPITNLTATTIYNVLGTISGCPSNEAIITVNVIDVTEILPTQIQSVFEGQSTAINLTDAAQNPNLQFIWTPNLGISCATCNAPLVTLSSNQTYNVQITDLENGCIGQDSVKIQIISDCNDGLVIVPNAFSPNNDGLNDVLYVRGSTLEFVYNFKVYSRSGELVFETTDINKGWDGTHNGQELNTGVYVYYVEAPCALNGSVILKTGNVMIIR
jgi:gliding motility-associated-like protein